MKTKGRGLKLHQRPPPSTATVSNPSKSDYSEVESKLTPFGTLISNSDEVGFVTIPPQLPPNTSSQTASVKKCHKEREIKIKPRRTTLQSQTSPPSRPKTAEVRIRTESRPQTADFKKTDFNHFCAAEEVTLDIATQLQRQINAATNIQRIFRGHIVRNYMKKIKASKQERQKKIAKIIAYAEKTHRRHMKHVRESLESRENTWNDPKWIKQYELKAKELEKARKKKIVQSKKKAARFESKLKNTLNSKIASDHIHDIFSNKVLSKSVMRKAAITIQRFVRGWLVRLHFKKAKSKAMKRTLDFKHFIHNVYRPHLEKIMKKYGIENPKIALRFNELLQYIEKRNKYEIEFEKLLSTDKTTKRLTFQEVRKFFEACNLYPSTEELMKAVRKCLDEEEDGKIKQHEFTKTELVDISFLIYVPKGTNLGNTRKSTWMNPLIQGEEALSLIGKKGMEETNLEQCLNVVSKLFREGNGDTDFLDLSSTDNKKEPKEKKSPKPRRVSKRK